MKKTTVKTIRITAILCVLLTALLAVQPLAADSASRSTSRDWPAWNGPNRDLTLAADAFDADGFGLAPAWVKALGSGYSGILVSGDKVVTAFSDGESDLLAAFDAASGEELWRYRIAETYKGHDGSDDGPVSTPTVSDGVVYGLGPFGHLFAARLADGSEVWSKKLDEKLARAPGYGFTTAPTVVEGVLVVQTGGADGFAICGFDRTNGDLLWSTADDGVSYQSPTWMEIGGKVQVLAFTDKFMIGLDPATGEERWRHQYATGDGGEGSYAQPILVGENRVLTTSWRAAKMWKIEPDEDGAKVEMLWESRAFRDNYAVPVPHEGYLYGYAGYFLTCADAATGQVQWKSRPPGEGNLVLVDGHLVIQTSGGDVVVAKADPTGYREVARVKALDKGSLTKPSFAGGRVYVRNLTQIASVAIVDAPVAAPEIADLEPRREALGEFGAWAREVEGLEKPADRKARIERRLAKQKTFPILEDGGLVHFVYQGEVEDLALAANFLPGNGEEVMERIEGTDFYYLSYQLEPASLFTYRFQEFEKEILDPRNPRRTADLFGDMSVVMTEGWKKPSWLDEAKGDQGSLETKTWRSEITGNTREITIYQPAKKPKKGERPSLLVVTYGKQALESGGFDHIIDNLVRGGEIRPLVVAFVPRLSFSEAAGGDAVTMAKALAEELVPFLEETYGTSPEAADRGIWGAVSGSALAALTAATYPDVFGKLGVQSFYFGENREAVIQGLVHGGLEKLVADIEVRAHDYATDSVDAAVEGRQLAEIFHRHDGKARLREIGDGYGWASWSARLGDVLIELFPRK